MTPETSTPRTDAIAHRGYNESAYIAEMTDLARQLERELFACREWSSKLADVADDLRADLATERELADRLALELEGCAELTGAHGALDAWKEARK